MPDQGEMRLVVWDVAHGACAMLRHYLNGQFGRLAMIDSGSSATWRPSTFIRQNLGLQRLDYLFITNADQDHMSDLRGLEDAGIQIHTLRRNTSYNRHQIHAIKARGGPLSPDACWYVEACETYCTPTQLPFDLNMGGITAKTFRNSYPAFSDTNNLSLAVFIQFGQFKILFPGDLEKMGWRALLAQPAFRAELATTEIVVASHHGRESGFCEEVFDHCTPSAVVISDKPIAHATQETVPDYRRVVRDQGVLVRTTGKMRHVLTTRRDGTISFFVGPNGYDIETEYRG